MEIDNSEQQIWMCYILDWWSYAQKITQRKNWSKWLLVTKTIKSDFCTLLITKEKSELSIKQPLIK